MISVRYSPSVAVPKIMRPFGVHFTNCVISCQKLSVLAGVGQQAVHFVISELKAMLLKSLLELGRDEWCQFLP